MIYTHAAEMELNSSIKLNLSFRQINVELGRLLARQGRWDDAQTTLLKAVSIQGTIEVNDLNEAYLVLALISGVLEKQSEEERYIAKYIETLEKPHRILVYFLGDWPFSLLSKDSKMTQKQRLSKLLRLSKISKMRSIFIPCATTCWQIFITRKVECLRMNEHIY